MNNVNRFIFFTAVFSTAMVSCMQEEPADKPLSIAQNVAAGAAAGVIEVFPAGQAFSYFTNQVINNHEFTLDSKKWGNPAFPKVISLYPRDVWRGTLTNAGSMGPITAIQVAGNAKLQETGKALKGSELTDMEKLMASIAAGAAAGLVATPTEFVPYYMQNNNYNTIEALKSMYTKYGPKIFFRGLTATSGRDGVFTAGYTTLTAIFKKRLEGTMNPYMAQLFAGMAAGVITAGVTQPLHVIARRMQSQPKYKNSLATGVDIYKTEGIKGLYNGIKPRGARILVAIPVLSTATGKITDYMKSKARKA